MIGNQLFSSLRNMPHKELKSFSVYVGCPLFNKRAELVSLCNFLVEHLLSSKNEFPSPERLYEAAFPGKTFQNAQLRHTISYLLELYYQYLAWVEFKDDTTQQNLYRCRALRRRGMDNQFEKEWKEQLVQLEKPFTRDANFHYQRYLLLQEGLEHSTRRERSGKINLQPLPDELTTFYIADMLRHACSTIVHKSVTGQHYEISLIQTILDLAQQPKWRKNAAVSTYYYAYQMLTQPEKTEFFETLKSHLNQFSNCFSPKELRGLYLLAINNCIRLMNTGNRTYIREAFNLYQTALANDLMTENGQISGFTYKNIIRISIALDEHDWALQFLNDYRSFLHARERETLYKYNLAYLYFQQQDYIHAMPLLQQVELEDPLNNLDARRMLLRSYFELKEWIALDSLLQSFSAYLRRSKNIGYHRDTNEKLIYFTKKLIELNLTGNKNNQAQIRIELEQTQDVAERAWLLKQC
jgi:hypothetical protein